MNIGEEIVRAYLQHVKKCDFTQTNVYNPDVQGEIDVVGIDLDNNKVYICEVAVHLITGLQYTKNNRPNNINKLTEKFKKDIEYAKKYFPEYEKIIMLWTPIVKNQSSKSKYNQLDDVNKIQENVKKEFKIELELIINKKFFKCLEELRNYASEETKNIQSPVIRLMQIEKYLEKHIKKLK